MANLKVDYKRVARNLGLTVLVVFACLAINVATVPFYRLEVPTYVTQEEVQAVQAQQMAKPWYDLVVTGPAMEELLMRGPVFMVLLVLMSVRLDGRRFFKYLLYGMVILAGAWFGIMHVLNGGAYLCPSRIVAISLQGVLFGALMLRTRNILHPVLAHGGFNALVLGLV